MKTNHFRANCTGLLLISLLFTSGLSSIIKTRKTPDLHIKVFHPAPERNLKSVVISKELGSQDYSFNDDHLEITKKEFMDNLAFGTHMNLHKPLKNYYSNSNSRLLEAEDINVEFPQKMEDGIKGGCPDCTFETKDNVTVVSNGDGPFVDITLKVRPEDKTKDEDHNVIITMDNYKYTGEFDKKKMEGLAIIESQEEHRGEIDKFVLNNVKAFQEAEEDVETKTENGLASIGQGLEDLLKEIDPEIKKVSGDENRGFVFEKRANNIIMVLIMAYSVGNEMFEIRVKTRAMDEFEMQVREYLREEDKTALTSQLGEILKSPALTNSPTIQAISEELNKLIESSKSNTELVEGCDGEMKFVSDESGEVPNTAVLNLLAGGGGGGEDFMGGMDFLGGGGGGEEDKPKEAPKICMFDSSFVHLMEILEMPYLFFSFRNARMIVEHFIPAVDLASTNKALSDAFNGIVNLNKTVEAAVKSNMDAEGNAIENPKEFAKEDLIGEIEGVAKKLKLKKVANDNKIFWEEAKGNVKRILMIEINGATKVQFNFPHKLYGEKETTKPITNEFIFTDSIAYDAVKVFSETLNQFVTAMEQAKKI